MIKVKKGSVSNKYEDVDHMVTARLDGAAHGNGQMETIEDTARHNSHAIGRLLTILHKKKKLSLREILLICDGYIDSSTKILTKKSKGI